MIQLTEHDRGFDSPPDNPAKSNRQTTSQEERLNEASGRLEDSPEGDEGFLLASPQPVLPWPRIFPPL
jgi:hypothetical protein